MLDPLGFLLVAVLIALNAAFVMTEYAMVTVRWTRVEELVERRVYGARLVKRAIERMEATIAATQLGVTLCSLGLGWIGEPAIAHKLQPLVRHLPLPWPAGWAHGAAITLAFVAISYLHVVLGELAPKAIALQNAETYALFFAGPLLAFETLTKPLSALMRGSGRLVVRLLHVPEPTPEQQAHSSEEIDRLVEEGEEAGVIAPDEARYVRAVFELSDKTVRDVMVPRDKVVTLSLGAGEEEILETARETAHTRMPVWEGTPDNVVGIVNTKDLFHVFSLRGLVILMDATYPALFVDPDQPVSRVLNRFRRAKRQMAVVRDREGRFLGIVTLEDILEEIVGEIEDEHD